MKKLTHLGEDVVVLDVRDEVVLEVQPPQLGEHPKGVPVEELEAVGAEVEVGEGVAELPAVVGDVVHAVVRQREHPGVGKGDDLDCHGFSSSHHSLITEWTCRCSYWRSVQHFEFFLHPSNPCLYA